MDRTWWSERRGLSCILSSQGLGGVNTGFEMKGKVLAWTGLGSGSPRWEGMGKKVQPCLLSGDKQRPGH